jgi:putative membrane protein
MATPVPEQSTPPRRDGFYLPRWLLVSLGGVVVLAIGFALGRLVDRKSGDRFDGFRDHANGHPALRILIALIVIALVVTAIVMLVRHFSAKEHGERATERTTAEQTLADRFARGEIDEAEFVRRRAALRS